MTEAALRNDHEARLERWTAPGGDVSVHVFTSKEAAGAYVAGVIAGALQSAVAERGKALWIGCGGTTPRMIYESLTGLDLPWDKITLGQVDERFVPVDDVQSNTRMMRDALDPVLGSAIGGMSDPVLDSIPGQAPALAQNAGGMTFLSLIEDITDADTCAALAEDRLRSLAGGAAPMFDIALLGMGPDAHYASIFPQHPINATVYDTDRLVVPIAATGTSLEPVLPRITLTVPALNNSRRILFFITGATKLEVLRTASQSTDPYVSPIGAFLAQCPVPVDFVWAE